MTEKGFIKTKREKGVESCEWRLAVVNWSWWRLWCSPAVVGVAVVLLVVFHGGWRCLEWWWSSI